MQTVVADVPVAVVPMETWLIRIGGAYDVKLYEMLNRGKIKDTYANYSKPDSIYSDFITDGFDLLAITLFNKLLNTVQSANPKVQKHIAYSLDNSVTTCKK